MPNWANVTYVLTGTQEHIVDLESKLRAMEEKDMAPVRNDFGKLWLGTLVHVLGGDWEKVPCRGVITYWTRDDDGEDARLWLELEVAWWEQRGLREFIEGRYPGVKVHYRADEIGVGMFATNDKEMWPYDWHLDVWFDDPDDGECPDHGDFGDFMEDLDDVADLLESELNIHIDDRSDDGILKALDEYQDNHDRFNYSLDAVRLIE